MAPPAGGAGHRPPSVGPVHEARGRPSDQPGLSHGPATLRPPRSPHRAQPSQRRWRPTVQALAAPRRTGLRLDAGPGGMCDVERWGHTCRSRRSRRVRDLRPWTRHPSESDHRSHGARDRQRHLVPPSTRLARSGLLRRRRCAPPWEPGGCCDLGRDPRVGVGHHV